MNCGKNWANIPGLSLAPWRDQTERPFFKANDVSFDRVLWRFSKSHVVRPKGLGRKVLQFIRARVFGWLSEFKNHMNRDELSLSD